MPLTKRTPAGRYLQTSGKAVYVASIAALTPFQTYSCMPFQATALEGQFLPAMPLVSDGSAPWPKPYKLQGVLLDPPVKGGKERGKRAAQGANSLQIVDKWIDYSMIEEGSMRAHAVLEVHRDIATTRDALAREG